MKRIYIAGPYENDDQKEKRLNTIRAAEAAATLYRKGWAPFCPHMMTYDFEVQFPDIKREVYLETDLEWLKYCDAILMLLGWQRSEGARAELRQADILGLDRYYALKDVPDLTVAKPTEKDEAEVVQNPAVQDAGYLPDDVVVGTYPNQTTVGALWAETAHFGERGPNAINHPSHYTQGKMECIEAIEGLGLPFHEAQVLKYIVRWRHKGGVEDLKKAQWFLKRLLSIVDNGGVITNER